MPGPRSVDWETATLSLSNRDPRVPEMEWRLRKYKDQCQDLELQLSAKEDECTSLKVEIQTLNRELTHSRHCHDAWRAFAQEELVHTFSGDLAADIESLRLKLHNERRRFQYEMEDLKEHMADSRFAHEEAQQLLNRQRRDDQDALVALDSQNSKLQANLADHRQRSTEARQRLAELSTENEELKDDVARLLQRANHPGSLRFAFATENACVQTEPQSPVTADVDTQTMLAVAVTPMTPASELFWDEPRPSVVTPMHHEAGHCLEDELPMPRSPSSVSPLAVPQALPTPPAAEEDEPVAGEAPTPQKKPTARPRRRRRPAERKGRGPFAFGDELFSRTRQRMEKRRGLKEKAARGIEVQRNAAASAFRCTKRVSGWR